MTYSIVARDPATGELGVAVQSRYFAVGADVSWVEAGVGAVASQALALTRYGARGLVLLREGASAEAALAELVREDEGRETRQVAIVDAVGGVAVHTGAACIAAAGHRTGPGWSVQANMMVDDGVVPALATAFEAAEGPLAVRLLTALEAAEAAGGDVRGRQSAVLLVVPGARDEAPGQSRIVDVRVDDHPQPLVELRRLLGLRRAFLAVEEADGRWEAGHRDEALALMATGRAAAPEETQLAWWHGCLLAAAGRSDEARAVLASLAAERARWLETGRRFAAAGLLPVEVARLEALLP